MSKVTITIEKGTTTYVKRISAQLNEQELNEVVSDIYQKFFKD